MSSIFHKSRPAFIALLTAFIALSAFAEAWGAMSPASASLQTKPKPGATSTSTVTAPVDSAPKKSWAFELMPTYSSSIQETSSADYQSSLSVNAVAAYRLTSLLTMDLATGWKKDLTGLREARLDRTVVGLARKPIDLGKSAFKYRPKLSVSLPTAEEERNLTSYQGGIGLSNRFIADLHPDWTTYYQVGLTKNFFGYTTTGKGVSNQSYSVSHRLLINKAFGDFYVETGPMVTSRWTFEGTVSNIFEVYGEAGMEVAKGLTVGTGLSNSANLYKSNGRDSNFAVIDGDTTEVYLMMNWAL